MQGTQPPTAAAPPRRPRSTPLDNDLRNRLAVALSTERPEHIAARADVSAATVLRARNGTPVSGLVRAALARALGFNPSPAASVAA